ncbi:MAG: HrpJ domain-containing protein [Parachlamydiaceae bacterium]
MPDSGIQFDDGNLTINTMRQDALEKVQELSAEQESSQGAFLQSQEEAVNPFASKFATKDKKLEEQRPRIKETTKTEEKEEPINPVDQIKDTAEKFQKKNQELQSDVLAVLREQIKPGDTKEDILRKLQQFYPDATLADEVLDFLLATTDGELAKTVKEAKDDFSQIHAREIAAGRNISTQAREASQKGLGATTSLREMYYDITGNPRDSTTLFDELSQKYAFKDLKKVIDFLLHSLGADLKSKGPSIPKGLLHRLFTETRSLQAILGVYRFFRGRMHLMEKMFGEQEMELPSELSFENMAKQFMSLIGDRYPSSARVLQLAEKLGIEKWLLAKIIVFSQMRDAIREVAINQIYKSLQHRDDLYLAILEALEDLEDQLEEKEEEEEGEEKDKKDDDDDDSQKKQK